MRVLVVVCALLLLGGCSSILDYAEDALGITEDKEEAEAAVESEYIDSVVTSLAAQVAQDAAQAFAERLGVVLSDQEVSQLESEASVVAQAVVGRLLDTRAEAVRELEAKLRALE